MSDTAALADSTHVRGARKAISIESAYSWWIAGITLVIASLSFGAVTSIPVLLKPLARDWGTGAGTVALVHTSAMFGAAVGSLVFGRLLDRFGFFRIAVLAATATGAGLVLAASADDLLSLHLAYGLLIGGIGQGAFFSPLAAAVSQWFDRHRPLAIAIAASGQSIGGLGLPPLLRWSADAIGWRGTLELYGIVSGILLLTCALAFRRTPPPQAFLAVPQIAGGDRPSISRGGFVVLGLSIALLNLASFTVIGHLTAFGEEQGYPPAVAAALVSAMLGVTLVSRLTCGHLSSKWGTYHVLLSMCALHVIGVTWLTFADGFSSVLFGVLLIGLGFGGYVPGYAVLVRELFPAKEAGRRISEIYFFAFVSAGVGSWTGGWLRDLTGGYGIAFISGACAAVLGASLLLALRGRLRAL